MIHVLGKAFVIACIVRFNEGFTPPIVKNKLSDYGNFPGIEPVIWSSKEWSSNRFSEVVLSPEPPPLKKKEIGSVYLDGITDQELFLMSGDSPPVFSDQFHMVLGIYNSKNIQVGALFIRVLFYANAIQVFKSYGTQEDVAQGIIFLQYHAPEGMVVN
jgi:hypothetical protein